MLYFERSDFDCKETGQNGMSPKFLARIDVLRMMCGFPFIIVSGFRATTHSEEVKKEAPGTHSKGIASDIRVRNGYERMLVVKHALAMGFKGVGVGKTIVHVDDRTTVAVMWKY